MVLPWAKYDKKKKKKKKKSIQGFLRYRVYENPVRTDGQPENIMPPAPYGRRHKTPSRKARPEANMDMIHFEVILKNIHLIPQDQSILTLSIT